MVLTNTSGSDASVSISAFAKNLGLLEFENTLVEASKNTMQDVCLKSPSFGMILLVMELLDTRHVIIQYYGQKRHIVGMTKLPTFT